MAGSRWTFDAFDWVVTPNVIGMSQFATGGTFTTKPCISGARVATRDASIGAIDDQAVWVAESQCM